MARIIFSPGDRFTRLTIIKMLPAENYNTMALARCDCGNIVKKAAYYIKSKEVQSCGCLKKERVLQSITVHGLIKHPLYRVWKCMKARCYDKKDDSYKYYGGRGIEICDEWRKNFKLFYEWAISANWQMGLKVDRKNNDENYCPDNCRIITHSENIRNRSNTVFLTYNGQTLPLIKWAEMFFIPYKTLAARIKYGWSVERSLNEKIRKW